MLPSSDVIEQTRLSIAIKDYIGKDENFVREEFLIPIFKAAGYNAFGINYIARGVNLRNKGLLLSESKRHHIYPDFVLYKKDIAVWVIDAKSPKVSLHKSEYINQIISYSVKLNCPNCILSNARETLLLEVKNGSNYNIRLVSYNDLITKEIWDNFIYELKPETIIQRKMSIVKALELYDREEYIDRSVIMEILQSHEYHTINNIILEQKDKLLRSDKFRIRALPSILITPFIGENSKIFNEIILSSLSDGNCIVRENLLTTIIPKSKSLSKEVMNEIIEFSPHTYLEKFLFSIFMASTKLGQKRIKKLGSNDSLIKNYFKINSNLPVTSFPIALLTRKPADMSYTAYCTYLDMLPWLIERVYKDANIHDETIAVFSSCIKFAFDKNRGAFKRIINSSSRDQAKIIKTLNKLNR